MANHRQVGEVPAGTGAKGPGVGQHRLTMPPSDRAAAIAALLVLLVGAGVLIYLVVTIPTGGGEPAVVITP